MQCSICALFSSFSKVVYPVKRDQFLWHSWLRCFEKSQSEQSSQQVLGMGIFFETLGKASADDLTKSVEKMQICKAAIELFFIVCFSVLFRFSY